ncbi:MAG: hypothetical protein ABIS00_12305, partial [Gemmatimonadales bacterium]
MNRTRAILVAIGLLATPLVAQKPAASLGGFRFSTAYENEFNANRVQYGVRSTGEIGRKVGCGSCLTGGFWPKGSGDAYTYNSGAQVTGIIAGAKSASNPWGGDTAGGSFLPSGQLEHGTPFSEMFNSDSAVDPSNWPASARVPRGDATELLYHSTLRGREFAADGNLWFLTWEGDPARNGGRAHPLGVLAEVRLLGWNYPVGNDDLLYVVITYYNISSANAADYASYRPGMREKLLEAGQKFQALNNAKFGITLPVGGYTIAPFLAGFTTDFDVGGAGINSASVNLPNAFAFAWQTNFSQPAAWTFDPRLFGKPFFAGSGFVGMKFLKTATPSPTINLVSASVGGGAFGEPGNTTRLFRYQSGDIRPELGVSCNFGDPLVTHICYIKQDTPADARVFQSAPAVTLSPGGSTTIALAYLHAAPVAIPGYAGGAPNVTPVDVLRLGNAQQLALGSPKVDSIAGYAGYSDANGDGVVQPREMRTVPRSLYGKAQLAQAVFDAKFLLPSAPEPPDFFLIPGSNKVTVVWKPSITETAGDPYFEIAKNAATVPAGGGAPVPNPLYDPNFRKFDLEGYRLYRGRTDQPGALTLIAQYDYKGTSFDDYDGRVGENITCGPEFGFGNCVAFFDPIVPGVPRTKKITHDIVGDLVQVRDGDRTLLSNNAVAVLTADTSGRSYSKGARPLTNSGVPFVYQDSDVRNSSAYFYAVTAFDYNSIQSGPTMMESLRVAKRVVPVVPAGNLLNTASLEQGVYGRKGILT